MIKVSFYILFQLLTVAGLFAWGIHENHWSITILFIVLFIIQAFYTSRHVFYELTKKLKRMKQQILIIQNELEVQKNCNDEITNSPIYKYYTNHVQNLERMGCTEREISHFRNSTLRFMLNYYKKISRQKLYT